MIRTIAPVNFVSSIDRSFFQVFTGRLIETSLLQYSTFMQVAHIPNTTDARPFERYRCPLDDLLTLPTAKDTLHM